MADGLMLGLLIGYSSYWAEPRLVVAGRQGSPIDSLVTEVGSNSTVVRVYQVDDAVDRGTLAGELTGDLFVWRYTQDLADALGKRRCTQVNSTELCDAACCSYHGVSIADASIAWGALTIGQVFLLMADVVAPEVGVANPFTANVWNGFFAALILVILGGWATHKFHGIDVQTKFAKKIQ